MKCWFKKHKFKYAYDVIMGGILGRHIICKNCNLEYSLWWHIEKPRKPNYKTIRIKIKRYHY